MKVFLSWSGEKSHKVAIVFRDWLPSVIQSLIPYVSSEDIDKGTRWSTDIAKELADSSFGILCVTKENLTAPWLTFEAGALSKTLEKSFVSPFLFDIKRSDVDGPILQFQSTIFEKDDIQKLVRTLNKACDKDKLTDERLEKAFEVWYPTLEAELNKVKDTKEGPQKSKAISVTDKTNEILEEILDLTRLNQKLLRNPEGEHLKEMEEILSMLRHIVERTEMDRERSASRDKRRRLHPAFVEELLHVSPRFEKNLTGFQIALSLFRTDYPWLYDAGLEVVKTIRSKVSGEQKDEAVHAFLELVEFTFEHPVMREMFMPDKEMWMIGRELPLILKRTLSSYL